MIARCLTPAVLLAALGSVCFAQATAPSAAKAGPRGFLPDYSEGLTGLLGPFLWSRAADLGADARFCDEHGRPDVSGRFLWLYQLKRGGRGNPPMVQLHERNNLVGLDAAVGYEVQPWHVLVNQSTRQNLKLVAGYIRKGYRFEHGDNEDLVHLAGAPRVCLFIPICHGGEHAGQAVYDQKSYWISPVRGLQSVCVIEFDTDEMISYGWFKSDKLDRRILLDLAPHFDGDKRVHPGVTKPIFRFDVGDGGSWTLRIERDGWGRLAGGDSDGGWDMTFTDRSGGAKPYTVDLGRATSTWAFSAFSPGGRPEETSEVVVGLNPFDRGTGEPCAWPDRKRRIRTFRLDEMERVLAGGAPRGLAADGRK